MNWKRFLSLLLCAALVLTLLPATALAADHPLVDGGSLDLSTCAAGDTVTVAAGASVTISGSCNNIQIDCGAGVYLTLNDVHIDNAGSSATNLCALSFTGSGNTLALNGSSTLVSGPTQPGVRVKSGTSLTISDGPGAGIGELKATGNSNGAGIGSDKHYNGGDITITGGTVTANGSEGGAGIGGGGGFGLDGNGGTITVSGGTVTAQGGEEHGAGIGGGDSGDGGTVNISGGTVRAVAGGASLGTSGHAIGGGGSYGSSGIIGAPGSCTITGGSVYVGNGGMGPVPRNGSANGNAPVYLTTVTLQGAGAASVSSLATDVAGYAYGTNGIKTDSGGKLYLYLPDATKTTAADTASTHYGKNTVTTSATTAVAGTLWPPAFSVTGDTGYTYDDNGVLTFTAPGDYTVAMANGITTTATDKIVVNAAGSTAGDPVIITLKDVGIDVSGTNGACAFDMSGAVVSLALEGQSALKSGRDKPGVRVESGTALTISDGAGTGTLKATGGDRGAGIGGGNGGNGGTITVNGGIVNANGGIYGAGIGGGNCTSPGTGNGGTITINGGTVTANGGDFSAGIGGGIYGSGGTVNISGGMVSATGKFGGAGIGGGSHGSGDTVNISGGTVSANGLESRGAGIGGGDAQGAAQTTVGGTVNISGGSVLAQGYQPIGVGMGSSGNVTLTNGKGANVYLTTLTLPGISTPASIPQTELGFGGVAAGYGRNGLVTDEAGVLYFYLPVGDAFAAHGGAAYAETVEAAHTNVFALAAGQAYVVNYNFSHLTPEDPTSFAAGGGDFSVNFTSDPGFDFPDEVNVTMGGSVLAVFDDYTYGVAGTAYGRIVIPNVSGDILIEAAGDVEGTDATLSGLSLSEGTLSPDFASDIYEYTASVGNAVSSLTVRFDRNDGGAKIKVNGQAAAYVFHSDPIALAVGANTILVEVTAQDSITIKTYKITVTRAASAPTPTPRPTGGDSGPTYTLRTLTDNATGVTLTGSSIHELAKLTVSPLALHPNDPACDAIRKAQADGQFILGFNISLTPAANGPVTLSIPVGSQYNGKNVTILHCINGKLETITATVVNSMAAFTVKELSPFAVTTGLPVQDEITGVPNTGDTASSWGFLLIGLAVCAGYLAMRRRRV